jgi:hypothetical protein
MFAEAEFWISDRRAYGPFAVEAIRETFNPDQPVGQAVFALTPADLQGRLSDIASEILLHLSQWNLVS